MNYKKIEENAKSLRDNLNTGKEAKKKLEELLNKLTESPPDSPIRMAFWADKWDTEYRINFLLHFIEMKGLSKEANDFLSLFYEREDEE